MKAAATAGLAILSLVATDAQGHRATARVRRRVVAAATGRPLSRATVRLMSADNQKVFRAIKTDSNGRYDLGDLPEGRYAFVAAQTGYLDQQFDQPHPLARYRLLELTDGEQLDAINFALHRGSAITGVITDEMGDPLTDVRIQNIPATRARAAGIIARSATASSPRSTRTVCARRAPSPLPLFSCSSAVPRCRGYRR